MELIVILLIQQKGLTARDHKAARSVQMSMTMDQKLHDAHTVAATVSATEYSIDMLWRQSIC